MCELITKNYTTISVTDGLKSIDCYPKFKEIQDARFSDRETVTDISVTVHFSDRQTDRQTVIDISVTVLSCL